MTDRDPKPKAQGEHVDSVGTWDRRAAAYAALAVRFDLFERMAQGLVGRLTHAGGAEVVLDVGAGTGLVGRCWLQSGGRPDGLRASEPAATMCALLRAELARHGVPRSAVVAARAEELGEHFGSPPHRAPVDAALSSAALHLADLERALPALASAVRPGGALIFNLWWHRVSDDAARHTPQAHWRPALARALAELDEAPTLARPVRSASVEPIALANLTQLADASGWSWLECERVDAQVDGAFFVDFAALEPSFLDELAPARRAAVLDRARELAPPCSVGWREILLQRRGASR